MKKEQLLPLSGFRDYTSPTKDWVLNAIRETYQSYGYQPLETPTLERQEILLGKMGDEAQKQLYLFEDNGGRNVGLRYDLTVPLSRFVASNYEQLVFPYKRYEIGLAWRAEKPQKGRYRQFYQADADILGVESVAAEKELFSMAADIQKKLNFTSRYYINNRQVIDQIFDEIGVVASERGRVRTLLDKKNKLSNDEFTADLNQLSLSDVQRRNIRNVFVSEDANLKTIENLIGETPSIVELKELLEFTNQIGLDAVYSPSLMRGLDYYTGTIFESFGEGFSGSLSGGGRYDSLVDQLVGKKIPAVGISFGRIIDFLEGKYAEEPIFIVKLPETEHEVRAFATKLRDTGKQVEIFLDETVELGKQIKYADKRGYKSILIPFFDEWKKGQIVRKNLETGQQEAVNRDEML